MGFERSNNCLMAATTTLMLTLMLMLMLMRMLMRMMMMMIVAVLLMACEWAPVLYC